MLYRPATRPSLLRTVWDELQPYPGRLDLSVRMAVLCVLVVVVAMANKVPEAALSCYLIFFASKDNSGSGIIIGLGLIFAASVGIMLGVLFLMISAGSPFMRLAFIAAFTFGGMYFSQATRHGPMAGTVGFVFAFVMTLYDIIPIAEILTRALTWMWVVVFFPMFFLVLINVVAPRSPARLLREILANRFNAAADLVAGVEGAEKRAQTLLGEGNEKASTYQRMARLLSLATKTDNARSGSLIDLSYRMLALSLVRTQEGMEPQPELAVRLHGYAGAVSDKRLVERPMAVLGARDELTELVDETGIALSAAYVPTMVEKEPGEPLLAPDAFHNPRYTQFALKTLLAVMICYIAYTALDWFEIHTAMITCFYVALGTTGETVHKLTLRIVGCLIGAAMGVGAIIFLMPHMTDIGHLVLLIGAGSFIAAWISNGSERISYMGWQAALAFFLCTLGGFGPVFDIGVATNRIIGIIFGNIVVSVIFSTIWPVSIGGNVRKALAGAIDVLASALRGKPLTTHRASAFYTSAREAGRGSELLEFESERVRKSEITSGEADILLSEIKALSAPVLVLASEGQSLRGVPRYVKAATVRFESAVAQWLDNRASDIKNGHWADRTRPWDGSVKTVEIAFARAQRQAAGQGRKLPAAVRKEMAARLRLYRQMDARIAQMAANVRVA